MSAPSDARASRPATALEGLLRERIRAAGPLTFAAFMDAALYWPGDGYYDRPRRPWGAGGDYVTAPQVGPALGTALATLLQEAAAAAFDDGGPVDLVEFGSGDGALMGAMLERLAGSDPGLYRRLRAVCVERSATARRQLLERLPAPPGGLQVVAALDECARTVRGAIVSNELLDALPVERVRKSDGRLQQSWVELDGDRLVERFREPVQPALLRHLRDNDIELREGQVAELCLRAADWMAAAAGALRHGLLVSIDYGHETAALYGDGRDQGTLVCQRQFELFDEPLAAVAEQDITAHVDFGNLRRLGAAHGLQRGELCSLRVFLIGMGCVEDHADPLARLALRHLLVSELGDTHRVMLQTRGAGLDGLRFGRSRLQAPGTGTC